MIYFIFIALLVGIIIFKFAQKLLEEERLIKNRKERKIEWDKKKGVQHGNRVRRSNNLSDRKK